MADDRNAVLKALAEHLPSKRATPVRVTRRGVALILGIVVLLVGSRLGLSDILATLLALFIGLVWLRFGPAARATGCDPSD